MTTGEMKRSVSGLAVAAIAVLSLAGCSTARSDAGIATGESASAFIQTGEASWYGRPLHGRRTASGEIYDMYRLTAAHPDLPLGTRVIVTNMKNGRSVAVRVNDRGPYVRGRVIDLSYAAARALHAVSDGTVPVLIQVLEPRPAE